MSKMRPKAERSIPMEERQVSTDLRDSSGVERKLGFFSKAFVGLIFSFSR